MRAASDLSFVQFLKNRPKVVFEIWDVRLNDIPDFIEINSPIIMYKDVSESCYPSPGDLGVCCFEVIG